MKARAYCYSAFAATMLGLCVPCALAGVDVAGQGARAPDPSLLPAERFLAEMRKLRVPVDTQQVSRASLTAAVNAVDPLGRVMDAGEARQLAGGTEAASSACATGGHVLATQEVWADDVFYVRLGGACGECIGGLCKTLRGMKDDKALSVILDLRGAEGCAVDRVQNLAGVFVEEGATLFSVEDYRGGIEQYRAAGGRVTNLSAVVLADVRTAGTCEALAAALQGRPGVVLIGERTLGDGRLREMLDIGCGMYAYVGTRFARRANGKTWVTTGVEPDVAVTAAAAGSIKPSAYETGRMGRDVSAQEQERASLLKKAGDDAVLQRAIDAALGLRALAGARKPGAT